MRLRKAKADSTSDDAMPTKDWQAKAFDLVKMEYETLRAESAQARQSQQSIIQWSLATIGVVTTGGIVIVNMGFSESIDQTDQQVLYAIFLIWFGVGIPCAAWLSCLAWFGELIRMERAGRYLRGLEAVVRQMLVDLLGPSGEPSYLASPLRWETYISTRDGRTLGESKQRLGYVGSLGLYFGAVVLSLAIYLIRIWLAPVFWASLQARLALTAYALLLLIAISVSVVIVVRALERTSRQAGAVSPPASR